MEQRTCTAAGCERPMKSRGMCNTHYEQMRRSGQLPAPLTHRERFAMGYRILEDGCWRWMRTLGHNGYGQFGMNRRHVYAHRAAYMLFIGPIPAGMQVDHICHTIDLSCKAGDECLHRRCVNPDHLELVTPRENQLRGHGTFAAINSVKTHCPAGHPYDEKNTHYNYDGSRTCRKCDSEYHKLLYRR